MAKRISEEERIFEYFRDASEKDALEQYKLIGFQLKMRGIGQPPPDGRRKPPATEQIRLKEPVRTNLCTCGHMHMSQQSECDYPYCTCVKFRSPSSE